MDFTKCNVSQYGQNTKIPVKTGHIAKLADYVLF